MKKVMYVAPELEVLEVMVEQGFAGSVTDGNFTPGGTPTGPEGGFDF